MQTSTFFVFLLLGLFVCACHSNPFSRQDFYVSPDYQAELDTSIATASDPAVVATLQKMRNLPTAYWIDVKEKIGNVTQFLQDAASKTPAKLVVFIIYNIPNRDCNAVASDGQICCYANSNGSCNYLQSGNCSAGINEYKTQYIDPIAAIFAEYQDKVPIVVVIEPDALPNLATSKGHIRCGNSATSTAYSTGIAYAVKTIALNAPKVTIYLDGAHGGWLGGQGNMQSFASLVMGMNVVQYIRGFATNIAGYQPLGVQCPQVGWCLKGQHQSDPCCADPCGLAALGNPANNEMNYVAVLSQTFQASGFSPKFIVDTGRNGVANLKGACANWCNIRGAGVGHFPANNTANPMLIDAYFWLKTPGESDGCTSTLPDGSQCKRYDSHCGLSESIGSSNGEPRAPEAGKWFDFQVKQLAANSNIGELSPTTTPTAAPQTAAPHTPAPQTAAPHTPAPQTAAPHAPAPQTPAPHTPAPHTLAPQTAAPHTPAPQTAAAPHTSSPSQSGGSCSNKIYNQCGGITFRGNSCCPSGSSCKSANKYYSQCLP